MKFVPAMVCVVLIAILAVFLFPTAGNITYGVIGLITGYLLSKINENSHVG